MPRIPEEKTQYELPTAMIGVRLSRHERIGGHTGSTVEQSRTFEGRLGTHRMGSCAGARVLPPLLLVIRNLKSDNGEPDVYPCQGDTGQSGTRAWTRRPFAAVEQSTSGSPRSHALKEIRASLN